MARRAKPITPERREELDAAMEATGGVVSHAAKILKCKDTTLKFWIKSDSILKAKWFGLDPEEDTSIHKPEITDQERSALAFAKEEVNMAKGWGSLGFDLKETEKLLQISNFTNGRMEKITDLTTGGMSRNAARLLLLFDETYEKIQEVMANPEKYHEYEQRGKDGEGGQKIVYSGWKKLKELMNTLLEIAKETRSTNDAAQASIIQRAKIEEIKKRMAEDSKGPKKVPGFGGPPEVYGNPTFVQNNYGSSKKEEKNANE